MRSSGRLIVDPVLHPAKNARFHAHVVCGPTTSDCIVWTGAIGANSCFRVHLTRKEGRCVSRHRYALAIAGGSVAAEVLSFHTNGNPGVSEDRGRGRRSMARHVRLAGLQHDAHIADAYASSVVVCRIANLLGRAAQAIGCAVRRLCNRSDGAAMHAALDMVCTVTDHRWLTAAATSSSVCGRPLGRP